MEDQITNNTPIDSEDEERQEQRHNAVEIIEGTGHSRLVERRTVENVMEDGYLR